MTNGKKSTSGLMIGGLIVLLVIIATGAARSGLFAGQVGNGYKAVFISNGQVYFGKVVGSEKSDPLVLRDVYYPQLQQVAQAKPDPSASPQTQLQLVKMGNETHGPKDEIRFNRSQVLYIEDLKDDGVVVKSIHSFQANGSSGGSQSGTAPVASPSPAARPSK